MGRSNIDLAVAAYQRLPEVLGIMGYEALRKGQDDAVWGAVAGKDLLVVLPTALGKSAVYIIPTLLMQWKTVIFSPLISLMQDQLESLQRKGLHAGQLSSGQTNAENENTIREWQAGILDFLLVAPERIQNKKFIEALNRVSPDMIVIDEAHCVSAWSRNFRSDYCLIRDIVAQFNPEVVLAMTATCPKKVEVDIRRELNLEDAKMVMYLPPRLNLHFHTYRWWDIQGKSPSQTAAYRLQPNEVNDYRLVELFNEREGSFIMYCATVRETQRLYDATKGQITGGALVYNGKMTSNQRASNQQLFMSGEVRGMYATNSFGMGVDKEDIRDVWHRDLPASLEAIMQEAGRAGRDGKAAECGLIYDKESLRTQEYFIEMGYPSKREIGSFFAAVQRHSTLNGACSSMIKDLCIDAGVNPRMSQAILENLYGFRVLERAEGAKLAQIKLLKPHIDGKFESYFDQITNIGIPNQHQMLEVDLEFLATQMSLTPGTVKTHLLALDEEQYIQYVPPPRTNPLMTIGDLSLVDFGILEEEERDSRIKLAEVKQFFDTPNDQKHKVLTDYFTK